MYFHARYNFILMNVDYTMYVTDARILDSHLGFVTMPEHLNQTMVT